MDFWRTPHNPGAFDDDFEGQPTQGWFHQWVLGVLLPAAAAAWGAWALVTRRIEYDGSGASLSLAGVNAVAFGVALMSLGLFLHCHYFWGNVYDQAWFAVLGKIIGAVGFIGGLGVVIVRAGVLGRG